MKRPLLTLTTDFGYSDHFVGTMKGVILRIHPFVQIIDLSHEVSAYNVSEAGFVVAQAYPYFPPKTVHVVVVDPGVGTSRRPILVEAAGQFFVGPDNGVFDMILSGEKHRVRAITAEKYFLKPLSATFHGRDIFAPVGAHLAKGVSPARMGKPISDYLRLLSHKPVRTARRGWTGAVLKIDRFGNLITNFHISEFPHFETQAFEMQVGLETVTRLAKHYAEAEPGKPFLIVGSSGYIEVAANQASAAKLLGCGVGAPVELRIF